MITSILIFEVLIWVFLAHFFDTMPAWLRVFCFVLWVICHFIAYGSEYNLRKKVENLEDEVKKSKKGGE